MAKDPPLSSVSPRGDQGQSYLHGYSSTERQRLLAQAETLGPVVFRRVTWPSVASGGRILEVGCGLGAQTQILLQRFPELHVTGVDREPSQIESARVTLAEPIRKGRVELCDANAMSLPFQDGAFDGAFVCWLLEHVASAADVLQEVWRVLKPGGLVYCTEVFNSSAATFPRCHHLHRYWSIFADLQRQLGGDPDLGIRLDGLLSAAGFIEVSAYPLEFTFDHRLADRTAREDALAYWRDLLLSARPLFKENGLFDADLEERMVAELAGLVQRPDAVLQVLAMQARARK